MADSCSHKLCSTWSSSRDSDGSSLFFTAALSVKVWNVSYLLLLFLPGFCILKIKHRIDCYYLMQFFDITNVYSLPRNTCFSGISWSWLCQVQVSCCLWIVLNTEVLTFSLDSLQCNANIWTSLALFYLKISEHYKHVLSPCLRPEGLCVRVFLTCKIHSLACAPNSISLLGSSFFKFTKLQILIWCLGSFIDLLNNICISMMDYLLLRYPTFARNTWP